MQREKTEAEIQAEVLAAVGAINGVQVMRVNSGLFLDHDGRRRVRSVDKGTHDILLCVMLTMKRHEQVPSGSMIAHLDKYYTFGQMVWFEIKKPGKNLSEDQVKSKNSWEASGALCYRITSAQEALDALNDIPHDIGVSRDRPTAGAIIN